MPKLTTLNQLDQLESSWFGRPPPRHGLNLLYWFSSECVQFDSSNKIYSYCDPVRGDFGFHRFENRPDNNGIRLLPSINLPYYEVGNLNHSGADELPDYVSEMFTGNRDGCNKDRIIVSLGFDQVYITEHSDQSNFNSQATYRISKGLLQIIRRQNRTNFLNEMGYYNKSQGFRSHPKNHVYQKYQTEVKIDVPEPQEYHIRIQPEEQRQTRRRGICGHCTIL